MADHKIELREKIRDALAAISGDEFTGEAASLLGVIGYSSQRTLLDQSGDPGEFCETFPAINPNTASEQEFLAGATRARVLFQFTDEEIADAGPQRRLIGDTTQFNSGNAKSFLFTTVELRGNEYPRGKYAQFTREINKRFPNIPAVVLFRTASGLITLAFIYRRQNRIDPERDVLGRVSLIREIKTDDPHRAHLDILAELSLADRFKWMDSHSKQHNFDGLLDAWLDALDTEELNRRFYRDLFDWFERAVGEARFPTSGAKTLRAEEHVIRLITRLLFIWFIKEKGLVAEDLFIEAQVGPLLKNYDRAGGDSYYRAVLQNLFFATLNTEIRQRRFSHGDNRDHRNFSVYRYGNEMTDPKALAALFRQTPFINGGLFDCLDTEKATGSGGYRIDYFTDKPSQRRGYSIPNRLFFDGDGLVTLLDNYKFTVEENTPAETEVALDPELLGKVFENLLAAYNPETKETARKQTGSYYTPRAVVDYMVDEALVASLAQKAQPTGGDASWWQERLRYLLDYDEAEDAGEFFDENETGELVRAIAELSVLDPAAGSGAFPMGVLHKLTLALRRLDQHNRIWEDLQKKLARERAASAFDTRDQRERDEELREISATFERYRESDYGRKLYLIQNSIYGVDIQPVACQIAKLRFFITLAIEQQPTGDPNTNYGIQPLPNLETRFLAANTLLELSGLNRELVSQRTAELQLQLNTNRERHYHATTRGKKLEYRARDKKLREELAQSLVDSGLQAGHAAKVAAWDPYDQNAHADWFEPGYMFGVEGGFDVIIGNPPYVQLLKNGGELRRLYQDAGFETIVSRGDIYQLFYEKGFRLLAQNGLLSYITSNSWLKAEYGKSTRNYMAENHTPLRLLEMGKDVFENVIVDASVLMARRGRNGEAGMAVDMDRLKVKDFPPSEALWSAFRPPNDRPWSILSATEQSVMAKMQSKGTPLRKWGVKIHRGVTTGFNEAFIIDNATKDALVAEDSKSAAIIKPILRGRDIQRYRAQWDGLWLIITKFGSYKTLPEEFPIIYNHLRRYEDQLRARGQCRYTRSKYSSQKDYLGQHHWLELDNNPKDAYLEMFTKDKLFWADMAKGGRFAYSSRDIFSNNKGYVMTGRYLNYLCALLNSSIVTWLIQNTAATTGMGLTEWTIVTVERIPVPQIPAAEQDPLTDLVDRILSAKDGQRYRPLRGHERGGGGDRPTHLRALWADGRGDCGRGGPGTVRTPGRPKSSGRRSTGAQWRRGSPQPPDAVAVEERFVGYERNVSGQRLSDEHPVEGVAVELRQSPGARGVI